MFIWEGFNSSRSEIQGQSKPIHERHRSFSNLLESFKVNWYPLECSCLGADLWYKIGLVTLMLEEVITCVLSFWLIKSMLCAILVNLGTELWIFSAWHMYIKTSLCWQCTKSHCWNFHFYLFIRVKGEWKCVIILPWAVAIINNLNLKCFTFSV